MLKRTLGWQRGGSGCLAGAFGRGQPAASVCQLPSHTPAVVPAPAFTRAAARGSGNKRPKRVDRQKLIVCLVGLPARGKTFLCNKLMCYLNW